jgi:hypothetical protein
LDITDAKSCRGAGCDLDHFLVRIKYKQRLSSKKWKPGGKRERYAINKFKEEERREKYRLEIKEGLEKDSSQDIQEEWENVKEC